MAQRTAGPQRDLAGLALLAQSLAGRCRYVNVIDLSTLGEHQLQLARRIGEQ